MNLGQLQHLYTKDGPFTSLHLDVTRQNEDAGYRLEKHWEQIRDELSSQGTPDHVLDQIAPLVTRPTGMAGEVRRTIVADDDTVLLDDLRAGHGGGRQAWTRGPLPDLAGWLQQTDGEVPFLLVVADREGADIDLFRAWSRPATEHEDVEGRTLHINKVSPGDWAQKQFQRRSEELWRDNAREVADTVRRLWAQYQPRVAILAGDPRARTEIHSVLDSTGDIQVAEIESGGRAAGSSTDAMWVDVEAVLARIWDDDRTAVVDALGAGTGQGGAVARGVQDVLRALVQGQVQRLVMDLESAGSQTIDPDDYSGLELPVATAEQGRLRADHVLVAAGAATDADLSLLPADVVGSDGVAALLRWEG